MAEHAGQALWELHGLLAALKMKAATSEESNAIFDGIQNLNMIGALIRVPAPEGEALTALMPRFLVPVSAQRSGPSVQTPPRNGKKKCTDAEFDEAVGLCESIIADLDQMPDPSDDFAVSLSEKAPSFLRDIKKYQNVTENQLIALRNMRSGQQRCIEYAG